ncbi:MAG: L,D-transpeptidase family protein [Prosthecobacter sp.]
MLTSLAWGLVATSSSAQPAGKSASTDIEAATRLQVLLDRANFGPGKIDGRYGGFTQKALVLYREAKGLPAMEAAPTEDAKATEQDKTKADDKNAKPEDEIVSTEEPKPKAERTLALPDLDDMDLQSVGEVFVEYQVTEADLKAVGDMPKKVPEMAEVKWLPYGTLGEMVAEKFHCDIDFLKELNPGKVDGLKPGDTVKVPNVEPFDVAGVKDLPLLDQLVMKREDAEKASDAEQDEPKKGNAATKGKDKNLASSKAGEAYKPAEDSKPPLPEAAQLAVEVHTKDNMLRLLEHGKLVAAYPVTIGSDETKSPQGEWKVRGIARLPDFRYDSSFLKTGERGDKTYLLPPGPNNLVGVVWIALNKRGIGLHGTGEPDRIGRSASHGCVRLANWDVARLATRVRAGVKVTID